VHQFHKHDKSIQVVIILTRQPEISKDLPRFNRRKQQPMVSQQQSYDLIRKSNCSQENPARQTPQESNRDQNWSEASVQCAKANKLNKCTEFQD